MRTSTLRIALALALSAGSVSTALAETTYRETLVHEATTPVTVDLTAETVLCSSADYGAKFLKILIPELSGLTLLDHQNFGAGAPCVASGQCRPGNMPSNILDGGAPTETVDISVKAVRLDEVDTTAQTCNTYLVERVHVAIRGIEFFHERSMPLGQRAIGDCTSGAAIDANTNGDHEDKADTQQPAVAPESGGCSTTSSSGTALLGFAMLGLVARRRRVTRS